MSISLGY